ncbi:hypothetical protein BH20PSE1_BH20PSE1_08880 [soil metagenome]
MRSRRASDRLIRFHTQNWDRETLAKGTAIAGVGRQRVGHFIGTLFSEPIPCSSRFTAVHPAPLPCGRPSDVQIGYPADL